MKPDSTIPFPTTPRADRSEMAVRVADTLADAVARGPNHALRTARTLTEDELRLGLEFVSVVLEVASCSARAMATALAERTEMAEGPARLH
jgi:hypothetical protein